MISERKKGFSIVCDDDDEKATSEAKDVESWVLDGALERAKAGASSQL